MTSVPETLYIDSLNTLSVKRKGKVQWHPILQSSASVAQVVGLLQQRNSDGDGRGMVKITRPRLGDWLGFGESG